MKVQQSFVIDQPPERLWEFFEQVEAVARCVPGVQSVEPIDDTSHKVRMTQSVGPMTATFDLKMTITQRRPNELMEFTAVGRAVKGAAGNVRTVNTVTLAPADGGTLVSLVSDMAMGGVLGSVGQKVIAKQAAGITKQFSASLEQAIKGGPVPAADEPVAAAASGASASAPHTTSAPELGPPAVAAPGPLLGDRRVWATLGVGALAGSWATLLALRLAGR
jgi:carbon monoxide dehydrogenase subunit G